MQKIRRALGKTFPAVVLAALLPDTALAHPGHGVADSLAAGLMHPLGGLDHVLMIIAVSLWAAQLQPASRIVVCAFLALFVGVGALLPVNGGATLEVAIALTVVGAGILLTFRWHWPLWATASLGAAFALIHGFAHGAEGPAGNGAYIIGLVLGTGALALVISFVATRIHMRTIWLRVGGIASAALGVVALVQV